LNHSVIPSVKSSEKTPCHHVVASFQTKCIVRRYIPSDFETEFSPSVITTDEIFPSVIPLVFSDFLVVVVLVLIWVLLVLMLLVIGL
jgi:hypothetical protein